MGNLVERMNIKIDSESARPVYEQIKQGIQVAILSGDLKKDDKLLPIRTLAKNLKSRVQGIFEIIFFRVQNFLAGFPDNNS